MPYTPAANALFVEKDGLERAVDAIEEAETTRLKALTKEQVVALAKEQFEVSSSDTKTALIADLASLAGLISPEGKRLEALKRDANREAEIWRRVEKAPVAVEAALQRVTDSLSKDPRAMMDAVVDLHSEREQAAQWKRVQSLIEGGEAPLEAALQVAKWVRREVMGVLLDGGRFSSSDTASLLYVHSDRAKARFLRAVSHSVPEVNGWFGFED